MHTKRKLYDTFSKTSDSDIQQLSHLLFHMFFESNDKSCIEIIDCKSAFNSDSFAQYNDTMLHHKYSFITIRS